VEQPRGDLDDRGERREANYEAVRRVVYTDPQAAAVRADSATYIATVLLKDIARTATHTRNYAESNDFLTLLSDGERLAGTHALGPEAGVKQLAAEIAAGPVAAI
jgi:pyruvate/2-oxoglutarate dehydrogenase complex dihydrolipoamide dehydrogenase (E3) component